MLTDKYINHAGRIFKWRKLIRAAVDAAHQDAETHREPGMPKDKTLNDPTADQAVRNMSHVDTVRIVPKRGGKAVYIQHPEVWLEIIDQTYSSYAETAPRTELAMHQLFDDGMSGEVLSGLMGISKQVFYAKRHRFLTEAVLAAAERGILNENGKRKIF